MLLLLLICVASCLYLYYAYKFRFFSSRGIPGPSPVPFFGNILDKFHKPWMQLAAQRVEEFGPLYGVFDGSKPKLVVKDPELIKKIMVQDFTHFTDRTPTRLEHPIEQKMMVMLPGDQWATWRKIVTPAFSPQKLKSMEPLMQESIDHLIAEIERRAEGGKAHVDIRLICDNFTLEVIARTGLGVDMNVHQNPDPIIDLMKENIATSPFRIVLCFMLPKWFKTLIEYTMFYKPGLEASVAYVKEVIHQRRKNPEFEQNTDFTSILMSASRDGKPMPEDEIVANVVDLFLAGLETVSLLLAAVTFLLAQHPQVQQRLYEEVVSVTAGDPKRVGIDSVNDMKFMDAVLNETLRLYSPSTYTERKVSKAYDMNGITLPVGLDILILTYLLHHDEKYHPAAETFDPDRFMPDRISQMDPFTFIPFGQGPRNCPAGRMALVLDKIALSRLLMRFEFVKSDNSSEFIDVSGTMDELLITSEFTVRFCPRKPVQ